MWDEKGHTDSEIFAISIELDKLLNRYYLLLQKIQSGATLIPSKPIFMKTKTKYRY
ncbi:MAG TPA: hypothetical protein DDW65_06065 [Firmicutes bacterium]|nr:hypothetical protein [Bacillota bacterium]